MPAARLQPERRAVEWFEFMGWWGIPGWVDRAAECQPIAVVGRIQSSPLRASFAQLYSKCLMPSDRPTLRSLAAEAGVSPMAVSLALRNSRGVSAKTRARIKKLAAQKGYRPDPVITKLMHHLRVRRPARFQASLCGLIERWPAGWVDTSHYLDRLLLGLRRRAAALGYAFDLVHPEDYPLHDRLQRVLLSRGIEGLVLLPLQQPRDLSHLLDWRRFATVSVTSSILAPAFHGVTPRHFDNMLLACRQLTRAGLHRIGLVLPKDWDLRVNHRWVGAITWHNQYGGANPVAPFISETHGLALDTPGLRAWITGERPDVIISDNVGHPALLEALKALPVAARPRLVTTNWPTVQAHAGIDQRVELIGSTAIDVLSAMITHGEKGVPPVPHTTMVPGLWVSGSLAPGPARRAGRTSGRVTR